MIQAWAPCSCTLQLSRLPDNFQTFSITPLSARLVSRLRVETQTLSFLRMPEESTKIILVWQTAPLCTTPAAFWIMNPVLLLVVFYGAGNSSAAAQKNPTAELAFNPLSNPQKQTSSAPQAFRFGLNHIGYQVICRRGLNALFIHVEMKTG